MDSNALDARMPLMLKNECPSLNHLLETLEEVNNGKMALLDGEPIDIVPDGSGSHSLSIASTWDGTCGCLEYCLHAHIE